MKKILILGAGLSSSSLIKYLLDHSKEHNWKVRVGDMSLEVAERKVDNHENGEAIEFDVFNEQQRIEEIKKMILYFLFYLFCLSKKVPKKDTPGQGPQLSKVFQRSLIIRTAPGEINASHLIGFKNDLF